MVIGLVARIVGYTALLTQAMEGITYSWPQVVLF